MESAKNCEGGQDCNRSTHSAVIVAAIVCFAGAFLFKKLAVGLISGTIPANPLKSKCRLATLLNTCVK
jgi:hypothetical protein